MTIDIKFGGTKEEQDKLSQLVLTGEKVATSSLVELNSNNKTHKGDIWQIMNSTNNCVCTVKVINVEMVPFNQVTDDFALKEGDGSFDNWYQIHSKYYHYMLHRTQQKRH